MIYSSPKLYKYSEIPFRITHCKSCDCELPEWQKMCPSCILLGQEDDIIRLQKSLWKKYIFYPYLKRLKVVECNGSQ